MITPAEIGIITTGLTEVLKSWGIPKKACPFVAIGIAIGFSVLNAFRSNGNYGDAILSGLVVGFTATGLYKAGEGMMERSRPERPTR